MIFGALNPDKCDINSLYICQTHLYTVATLPWEIQKGHFSTVLLMHTSDYLRYLRRKQTVTPLPTTPEKCHCTTLQIRAICFRLLGRLVNHLCTFSTESMPLLVSFARKRQVAVTYVFAAPTSSHTFIVNLTYIF